MGTVVLPYIHDLLQNFEQGHYDQCLKGTPTPSNLHELSSKDTETLNAIETSLKSLVERHVRLETENLRYQVALRQQQQLLCNAGKRDTMTKAQDASSLALPTHTSSASTEKQPVPTSALPITPEDGIWTMKDASVLDKVKTNSHVFPPLSLAGYFCKFYHPTFGNQQLRILTHCDVQLRQICLLHPLPLHPRLIILV